MKLQNAYTDAPELHENLLLGSLQLFFWLFFHPSAWGNHLARIDPTLSPHFTLAELSLAQWRQPTLQRLLLMTLVVSPLLVSLLIGLLLWMMGQPTRIISSGMAMGAMFGLSFNIWVGMTSSMALGYAGGMVGAMIGGIASLALNISPRNMVVGGFGAGFTFGMVTGVAGSVAITMASQRSDYSLTRQIGGMITGTAVGSVVSGFAFGGAYGVANITSPVYGLVWGLAFGSVLSSVLGIAIGLVFWWRTLKWRRGMVIGALMITVGLLLSGIGGAGFNPDNSGASSHVAYHIAVGVVGGSATGILFVLSYMLAERLAGQSAGGVAGALAGGAIYLAISISADYEFNVWFDLPLSLMSILLGLSMAWWRPLLLYPFEAFWNRWLYWKDQQHDESDSFRWHSAFWNEHQYLPLRGLDNHLLFVTERNPAEGLAAIEYLSASRQRWAAQAAQIELDARRLERCADVEAISRVSGGLAAGELEGPASALLRTFSRISQDVYVARQHTNRHRTRLALKAVEPRLDKLLRELWPSSEPYAVRFRPIAAHWRQIVADGAENMRQAAEQKQEIDNPYVFSVPLSPHEKIFVGRSDIIARLFEYFLQPHRPPLFLYGQRRMGKTSLLENLNHLLPRTIIPLFVDGQRISDANDAPDFIYNIAREIIKSAQRQRGLILPRLRRERLTEHPFTRFNEWLDEVEQALGTIEGQVALLMLDEFEELVGLFEKDKFDQRDLLRLLRHLIEHRPHFKLLLASSHALSEFEPWSSTLINVQIIKISYLTEHETKQLIEQPIKNFSLHYEPDATQHIYELTRGYPHLVQLLCYEMVEQKNAQASTKRRLACRADVEAAIPFALSSGSFFFTDIEQNQVSQNGIALLRYLAAQGEGAIIKRDALALQMTHDCDDTLNLLLQRDLIERIEGGYRFQVELIRRWFAKK